MFGCRQRWYIGIESCYTITEKATEKAAAKHTFRHSFQFVEKICFSTKVLVLNPYPQTPSPWEGAILLGLPPLDPVGGYAPATPFLSTIEVFRQTESCGETYISSQLLIQIRSQYFRTFCTAIIASTATVL